MDYSQWFSSSKYGQFSIEVPVIDALPVQIASSLRNKLSPEDSVKKILIAPKQRIPDKKPKQVLKILSSLRWRLSPIWVLVLTEDRLLIATIRDLDSPCEIISISFSDLFSLEFGSILLFSWIQLSWNDGGMISNLSVYFNTVKDDYYRELIVVMLRAIAEKDSSPSPKTQSSRDLLEQLPYKFKTILPLYILLPDDQVESILYQPPVYKMILKLYRRQQQTATVLLLTKFHLLTVREDTSYAGRYGWIANYCPRRWITRAAIEPREKDLVMNIFLENKGVVETISLSLDKSIELHLLDFLQPLSSGLTVDHIREASG